jgi:hypothetical protein
MSELDTRLAGLRDELHAAIPLPDVEHVTGRARARRQLQLAAIVTVIAVALAVPVLRAMPADSPAAGPPIRPTTTYAVDFADPDNGYALARTCAPNETDGCAFNLLRTADGGRDWRTMTLPAPVNPITGYFNAFMYVLGPDEIAIDRPGRSGSPMADRIYSTDGGRSWLVLTNPWAIDQTTALGPASVLVGSCRTQSASRDACGDLTTIRPENGLSVSIPAQPRLFPSQLVGTVATEDGKWWMSGRDTANGRWTMSVSADGGRQWSTVDLSFDSTTSVDGWEVVERDGVMYATASAARGLLAVWRSTDDGKSWTRTWAPGAAQRIPGLIGSPVAAADGTLILFDGVTSYVSTDRGHTFTRTGEKVGGARWTRAGYLRSDGYFYTLSSEGTRFSLSSDGLHWREFTVDR